MQVINRHEDIRLERPSVVALGNFDGVHIGHRVILDDAVRIAREKDALAVCYTFSNHPLNFFKCMIGKEEECIKLICTEEEKLKILEDIGFDVVINIQFDESIMKMRAHDFVYEILHERCKCICACCGFNYTFGVKAEGNVDYLRSEGKKLGMDVSILEPVTIDGMVVSSTEIRRLLAAGEMEMADKMLGRAYTLTGIVGHGEHLGTKIGFPTMNFNAPTTMALPPNGVYFTRAEIDGKLYPAITNIGFKPTVGGKYKTVETNMLDFSGDVYGEEVRVQFLYFERPEMKFGSVEELKEMIAKNVQSAIDYHREHLL